MANPSNVETAFQRAEEFVQAGRKAEAQQVIDQILRYTAQLIQRGDRQQAGQHLLRVLKTLDARNGTAWLQLADVVEPVEKKREALRSVPQGDPAYAAAQAALQALNAQPAVSEDPFRDSLARPIARRVAPPAAPTLAGTSNRRRISPGWLVAGVVLVVILGALGIGLLTRGSGNAAPDQVVQRFFSAAQAGDSTTVNALITEQYKAMLSLLSPEPAKTFARSLAGITQVKVLNTTIQSSPDNEAAVILQLHGQLDGKTGDFCQRFELLRLDSGWRIGNVRGLANCESAVASAPGTSLAPTPASVTATANPVAVNPTLDAAGLAAGQTATLLAQTRQALNQGPTLTTTFLAPGLTQTGLVAEQDDLNTAIAATQTAGVVQTRLAATLFQGMLEVGQTQTAMAQARAAQSQVAVGATQTFTAFTAALHGKVAFIEAHRIFTLSLPDRTIAQLSDDRSRIERAAWSPDGKSMAYEANNQIFVMNADGSNPRSLTAAFKQTATAPAWSPNGKQIAFAGGSGGKIWIMDATGSNFVQLTNDKTIDSGPAWSPDGKSIAYVAHVPFGDNQVTVMGIDGKNSHTLASGINPSWSSDGKHLLFESGERTGDKGVYIMAADGSNKRRLTDAKFQSAVPTWSPDGQYIIFASGRSNGWQLFAMPLDGSFVVQLTTDADNLSTLSWSQK